MNTKVLQGSVATLLRCGANGSFRCAITAESDGERILTRSSADADNRHDAFSGQSRSTNMVPFLGPLLLFATHVTGSTRHRRSVVNNAMDTPNTAPSVHLRSVAANCDCIFEFFHILARYFHKTRDWLNFLSVHP